ncbi:MDR family NADP-dependent oxidoreductase [Streptomyces sp. NEAU-S77]|uniref:MDR family NADP-dependent oxidoreductase n=1 Tax=Streptomyces sp. NEAU-S77 TaxID=3411033 RepID=UPI003B9E30D1
MTEPESVPVPVPSTHREVRLTARPEGRLRPDRFEVAEAPIPVPRHGQVLVRNRLTRVGAVTRTLMEDADAVLPMSRYEPGRALWAPALGEVVTAPGTRLGPGDLVRHQLGWREYAVMEADDARRVDPALWPDPAACLSQGFAGWLAVVRAAEVGPGDTVFVTGAAGGAGSIAGQFARVRGAGRVIGSTGSRRKADYLVGTLGFDAAVVRGEAPIAEQLRAAAPEGIDVLVDTVGGEQLRAALALARRGARCIVIGALSAQACGGTTAEVPVDTLALFSRGITLRGLTTADHRDAAPRWEEQFSRGLRAGVLTFPHTRLRGIERAPRALGELLDGHHIGTVLLES